MNDYDSELAEVVKFYKPLLENFIRNSNKLIDDVVWNHSLNGRQIFFDEAKLLVAVIFSS